MRFINKIKNFYAGIAARSKMATFNFDNLLKISFAKNLKGIFFIQVGACDGKLSDPIHRYIINYKWKGILVEPVKYLFARLVNNYKDVKENLIFENIAIAEKNAVRSIYRYKEDQRDLPSWYEGTASLLLNFEGRHKGAISGIKERLTTEQVRCVTFENLLQKYDIKNIDLLVIDSEGYDFNIIRSIDFGLIKPRVIFYENQCLSRSDNLRCRHFLTKRGYGLIDLGFDTLALYSKSMMIKVHLNLLGHGLRKLLISLRSRGGTKLRRIFLSFFLFLYNIRKKEDVAVVMGAKNISDTQRIVNAIKSIRGQDYDQNLIGIILVDYDSAPGFISGYQEMCKKYDVEYIRTAGKPIWNRANALNIGIKRAKTKYLLTTDVDIIFEKNYIKEALEALKKNPFQVLVNAMLDLPDIPIDGKSCYELRPLTVPRINYDLTYLNSITLTYTCFYHKLRGYDETYQLWGLEDDDLAKRFRLLGLNFKSLEGRTFYLHQYHERFRGVKDFPGLERHIKANRRYFNAVNSIIRNPIRWGE